MSVARPFDTARFRQVLGHLPTGVVVITAAADDCPVGLAVSSFVSVSLDPPLVAFFPDKRSSSWPLIEGTAAFCVNVLAEGQEQVCRRFASKETDRFAGVRYSVTAGSGSPILEGVLAWIDCDVETVTEAGDHFCVMGRVRELSIGHDGAPLLFFRGGYGRFTV